jgi:hypothetical protein
MHVFYTHENQRSHSIFTAMTIPTSFTISNSQADRLFDFSFEVHLNPPNGVCSWNPVDCSRDAQLPYWLSHRVKKTRAGLRTLHDICPCSYIENFRSTTEQKLFFNFFVFPFPKKKGAFPRTRRVTIFPAAHAKYKEFQSSSLLSVIHPRDHHYQARRNRITTTIDTLMSKRDGEEIAQIRPNTNMSFFFDIGISLC